MSRIQWKGRASGKRGEPAKIGGHRAARSQESTAGSCIRHTTSRSTSKGLFAHRGADERNLGRHHPEGGGAE